MSEASFQRVAAVSELREGQMMPVRVAERNLVLCRSRAGWHALDDLCTHADAALHEGRLRGTKLICPLHGAAFDCRTGAVLKGPATVPLRSYSVRCVGDDVEVAVTEG